MINILKKIRARLLFGRYKRPSNRSWIVYLLGDHPGTDLPMDVLRQLLPPGSLAVVNDVSVANQEGSFVYIGHGDATGAFSAEAFGGGVVRSRLAKPLDVDDWKISPQIWWCCFSARWLGGLGRQDWIGFSDFIGYDARGGQKKWWRIQLEGLLGKMLDAAERRSRVELIAAECASIYQKARQGYAADGSISYSSVLLAKLLSENLKMGREFGL